MEMLTELARQLMIDANDGDRAETRGCKEAACERDGYDEEATETLWAIFEWLREEDLDALWAVREQLRRA